MPSLPPSDPALDERLRLIVASYRRLTGKALLQLPPLPCRERAGERVESLYSIDSTPSLTLMEQLAIRLSPQADKSLVIPLQGGGDSAALREAIWNAPRAIVAHGTEDDPVFFYGNRLALQLFEMSFDEFALLPSRFSAEPLAREERARLLEQVTGQGYVDGYSGMRIAKSGRRFMIADGTVWNLIDEKGLHQGQAAVFVPQQ